MALPREGSTTTLPGREIVDFGTRALGSIKVITKDSRVSSDVDLPVRSSIGDDSNAELAAGKAVSILMKREKYGICTVNGESVYGVAIAMPQIARSAGWSRVFSALSVRAMMHLLVNYVVQGLVLYQIDLESNVFNLLGGQMHLCNYGQYYESCPGKTDCTGPGGTTYERATLHSNFASWSTRLYLKQALLDLFPASSEIIHTAIRIGEYGVQSPICRAICVFLFVIEVIDDLYDSFGIITLLLQTPKDDSTWIGYAPPSELSKNADGELFGRSELDYIQFRVNGIPLFWKAWSFVCVVLPKMILWTWLLLSGSQVLMETASIQDLIINSLALSFILQIDELILARLSTQATKIIMTKIEGYELYDASVDEDRQDQDVTREFEETELCWRIHHWAFLKMIFPRRLVLILFLTALVYYRYFWSFCRATVDGSYVSQDLYPPAKISTHFGVPTMFQWLFYPSGVGVPPSATWRGPPGG